MRKPSFESVLILYTDWVALDSHRRPNIRLCYFLFLYRSSYVLIQLTPPHLTIAHLTTQRLVYTNTLLATLNIRKSVIRPTSSVGGGGGGGGGGIGSRMVVDRTLSLRNLPSSPISPHVSLEYFIPPFFC